MQHPVDFDRAQTYEDFSIVLPRHRLHAFEQEDHVRICGRDFGDRLEEAGFAFEIVRYREALSHDELEAYCLDTEPDGDEIFVCR